MERGLTPQDEKDRNFVTALARGLDILRCFRSGETTLTNLDFSDRTGLPKPTVSRLTHTLCQLGYLVQEQQGGSYRLGVGVLRLGFSALASIDVCDRSAVALRDLRDGPNSYITAALGEAHRSDVIYVAVNRSRENVALTMHVGSRLPLFYSSMGRSILAGMPEAEQEAAVSAAFDDLGRSQDELWAIIRSAKEECSAKGYCTGFGLWREDVNAISAPVHSLEDGRIFGLNVGGPSFHVSPRQLEEDYAEKLVQAARFLGMKP